MKSIRKLAKNMNKSIVLPVVKLKIIDKIWLKFSECKVQCFLFFWELANKFV